MERHASGREGKHVRNGKGKEQKRGRKGERVWRETCWRGKNKGENVEEKVTCVGKEVKDGDGEGKVWSTESGRKNV